MDDQKTVAIKGQVRTSGSNHCLWDDAAHYPSTCMCMCVSVTQSHWNPSGQSGEHSPSVLESWGHGMEGRGPKLQKLVKDKAGLSTVPGWEELHITGARGVAGETEDKNER